MVNICRNCRFVRGALCIVHPHSGHAQQSLDVCIAQQWRELYAFYAVYDIVLCQLSHFTELMITKRAMVQLESDVFELQSVIDKQRLEIERLYRVVSQCCCCCC